MFSGHLTQGLGGWCGLLLRAAGGGGFLKVRPHGPVVERPFHFGVAHMRRRRLISGALQTPKCQPRAPRRSDAASNFRFSIRK